MNCFIDSNVWLFAFKGQDEEKTETARTLIEESEPAVSTQVVNETFVNLLRQADFTKRKYVRRLLRSICAIRFFS